MPPNNHLPSTGYSPEVLEDLAAAFNDVWAMLYAQVPPDSEDVVELSVSPALF